MTTDERYMNRCLELAKLGLRKAAPNPSVGCVIVHSGVIIGEGFTSPYGGNHAEVNAINSVDNKSLLGESTVYVSLEPCSHFGKTPPCADLLVHHKPKRVVIASLDPFAKVNGQGVRKLIENGIDVSIGVLENEAVEINKRFFCFHQNQRPYIILKWAETADGFVDSNEKQPIKITSEASNKLVHKWRSEESAILVGKNTAIKDNPSLTTRKYAGPNPVRILLDAKLEVSSDNSIFNDEAETIVITEIDSIANRTERTIKVHDITNISNLLTTLYEENILSVLVEGGPTTHQSFYGSGLWDEARRFISPESILSGINALNIQTQPNEEHNIGCDKLLVYKNS